MFHQYFIDVRGVYVIHLDHALGSLEAFLLQDRFFDGQYDEMIDAMRVSVAL